jgi:DNA polymerase III sliding clamp (beta) subunit (PCNA family)
MELKKRQIETLISLEKEKIFFHGMMDRAALHEKTYLMLYYSVKDQFMVQVPSKKFLNIVQFGFPGSFWR